jgi:hypothetical protein
MSFSLYTVPRVRLSLMDVKVIVNLKPLWIDRTTIVFLMFGLHEVFEGLQCRKGRIEGDDSGPSLPCLWDRMLFAKLYAA